MRYYKFVGALFQSNHTFVLFVRFSVYVPVSPSNLGLAMHMVDEGTLRNSNVEVDYMGFNTYKVSLIVKDEDGNRVYNRLNRTPVARLTDKCLGSTFSYCMHVGESTHHGVEDFIGLMK